MIITLAFSVIFTTNSFSTQIENNTYSFLKNNKAPNYSLAWNPNINVDEKKEKNIIKVISEMAPGGPAKLGGGFSFILEPFRYSFILSINNENIGKQNSEFYSNILFSQTSKLNILYSKNHINLNKNDIFISNPIAKSSNIKISSKIRLTLKQSLTDEYFQNIHFNVQSIGYSPIDILNQDTNTLIFNPKNEHFFYANDSFLANNNSNEGIFFFAEKNGKIINNYGDISDFCQKLDSKIHIKLKNEIDKDTAEYWYKNKHPIFFNKWFLTNENIVSGMIKINFYVGYFLAAIIFIFSFLIFLIVIKKFIEQRILEITTYKTVGYSTFQITFPFILFPIVIFFISFLASTTFSFIAQEFLIKSQEKIFNIYSSCFNLNWPFTLTLFFFVFIISLLLTFATTFIYIKKNIKANFSQKENIKPTTFSLFISYITFFYPFRIRLFFAFSSKIIGKILVSFFSALTCVILFMVSISGSSFLSSTYNSYNNDNNYNFISINTNYNYLSNIQTPNNPKIIESEEKYSDNSRTLPIIIDNDTILEQKDKIIISDDTSIQKAVDEIFSYKEDNQFDPYYFQISFEPLADKEEFFKKLNERNEKEKQKQDDRDTISAYDMAYLRSKIIGAGINKININFITNQSGFLNKNYFFRGTGLLKSSNTLDTKVSLLIADKYYYNNAGYKKYFSNLDWNFFIQLNIDYQKNEEFFQSNKYIPVIIGSGFAKKYSLSTGDTFGNNLFSPVDSQNTPEKSSEKFYVYKIFKWTSFNNAFYYKADFIFTSDLVISKFLKNNTPNDQAFLVFCDLFDNDVNKITPDYVSLTKSNCSTKTPKGDPYNYTSITALG
ncbi:ABC transporter permease [symbiont of Argiope bruennichi]|uniref:ABC transporter permease n=1 Tax=symbiont of Argiope bruennichi TaxID=2810479 RepID=UPI003DA2D79B